MILSDKDIKKKLENSEVEINPYPKDEQFQPASVDLTLGNDFMKLMWNSSTIGLGICTLDIKNPRKELKYHKCQFSKKHGITINPGDSILGTTVERIKLPNDLCARADGRSSLGRHFIGIHVTAGFIDPGYEGQLTLEITNQGSTAFVLYPGMRICQLIFEPLSSPCDRPYGQDVLKSKYQGQKGVVESKLERDFE